jgi:hypothetical protein
VPHTGPAAAFQRRGDGGDMRERRGRRIGKENVVVEMTRRYGLTT